MTLPPQWEKDAPALVEQASPLEGHFFRALNHVETGVTAVYDRHGYDLEKRAALDFWGKRLDQIISGKRSKVLAFVVRA